MGSLAAYLVGAFGEALPAGWSADPEGRILSGEHERRHGYEPRVDLLLRSPRGQRVAVELEVSRADPVANQAKFLVAQVAPGERLLGAEDALVSMVSGHVARGRRNLCGAFARHLRTAGLLAFQVSLLPQLDGRTIKLLNGLDAAALGERRLPVSAEVRRILDVVEPQGEREHRIHFAGDVVDVVENLWVWNDALATAEGRATWGRRTVQFLVAEPSHGVFAPSKFCAFVPAPRPGGPRPPATMTLPVYASLGESEPRFDGHRARRHLVDRLAFREVALEGSGHEARFEAWARAHAEAIGLRRPVALLLPPAWFAEPAARGR